MFSQDAVGEIIHLRGLLVDGRVVQRATASITNDAAIGKRMFLELEPAFVTLAARELMAISVDHNLGGAGLFGAAHAFAPMTFNLRL